MFFFPFYDISSLMPNSPSNFTKMVYSFLIIAIVLLWSFIDIVGSLLTLYIISYTDVEKKYPKYKKIIYFFKKSNYFFLGLEIFFFIFALLGIIIMCILLLNLPN